MGEGLFSDELLEKAGQGANAPDEHEEVKPEESAGEATNVADLFALNGMNVDIRTFSPLLARGNRQAEKLHNETTRLVRAQKQAEIGKAIYDLLTPREQKIYRRGRNAHPMHHARGASLEEYLQATALETLCGYLFLQGETERIAQILRTGIELTKRRGGELLL